MSATTVYTIRVDEQSVNHQTYESAYTAWQNIVTAVEDGRRLCAEFIRAERFQWDQLFYEGLLDPETGAPGAGIIAIPGICIISKRVIASLMLTINPLPRLSARGS